MRIWEPSTILAEIELILATTTLIELNNASLSPKSFRKNAKEADKEILRLCEKYEVPVVVSSDAHVEEDILNFEYADALLCEVNFPLELIVNTSAEKLKTALKKRRETEQ